MFPPTYTIHPVRNPSSLNAIRTLFTAYAEWLALDLSFQSFSAELANLPGAYAPPTGELLLAVNDDGEPVGCVGLRALHPSSKIEPEDESDVTSAHDVETTSAHLTPVQQQTLASKRQSEMKRLYVAPTARNTGLGHAPVERIIHSARERGYDSIKLDTLPSMHAAIALYEGLGFCRTTKYYDTPVDGTVFLELKL